MTQFQIFLIYCGGGMMGCRLGLHRSAQASALRIFIPLEWAMEQIRTATLSQ